MNAYRQQVLNYLDANSDELFALLSKLISFDSQNYVSRGNERLCAEYLADVYRDMGLETELYMPDDVPGMTAHPAYNQNRGTDSRPNVDGIMYGSDRDARILVAAHTDTMPVGEPGEWFVNPFGGEIRDGKLYGLGAGDNKEGLAAAVYAVKALQNAGAPIRKTIVLNAYCDEEYGGGGGALAACLRHNYEVIVNLDGGNFEIWRSALGGGCFSIEITKDKSTDTATQTVEALYYVLQRLEQMGELRRAELRSNPLYVGSDMERAAFRLHGFHCGNAGSDLNRGSIAFAIYSDKTKEEIDREFGRLNAELFETLAKNGFHVGPFVPESRFFEYREAAPDSMALTLIKKCTKEIIARPVKVCGACLSDLSIFLAFGCAISFSFGVLRDFSLPGGAHQPNEYVECNQALQHTKALALFLLDYCG